MTQVLVMNLHQKKKVNLKSIKNLSQKILSKEKNRQNLNIILTDDKYIIRLNRKFSRRNRSTDVLSFGMQEGEKMIPPSDVLGEIYISLDRAEKQAKDCKRSLQKEVNLLAAHGLLHLLGYDHKKKEQKEIMQKLEEKYLSSIS